MEKDFGTGAIKVTPGHDSVDYSIGTRHNLPVITIMNKDCTINEWGHCRMLSSYDGDVAGGGDDNGNNQVITSGYEGMDRFICREAIWNDLEVRTREEEVILYVITI